jgi:hypothetical protein
MLTTRNSSLISQVATTTRIGGARVPGVRLYMSKVDALLDDECSMDLM